MQKNRGAFFFCGIGGSGMSPLARLLAVRGERVSGSDRSYDAGRNLDFFNRLIGEGIRLFPQDGSGVTAEIDSFVVTRAVEEASPDIRRARELNLRFVRRPELVADLFAPGHSIAVGGTSGKSTTTGMIAWCLARQGRNPTVMNGAEVIDFGANFVAGGDLGVFEADESDGLNDVVGLCCPSVAVVTNISLDHFDLIELERIFGEFVSRATIGAVVNADCPVSMKIAARARRTVTFGVKERADVGLHDLPRGVALRGEHNIANALAALAAIRLFGADEGRAAEALAEFRGMRRRLELVATVNEIKVFDDFASNPGKIEATLRALRGEGRRLVAVFQPHGFQPTKHMLTGYIDVFSRVLGAGDTLIVSPIYYAGGSANVVAGRSVELPTDISGADIVRGITGGVTARYVERRAEVPGIVQEVAGPGDVVVSMGSRDDTLPELARAIGAALV